MHEILSEGGIFKPDVLVKPILPLMMLAHLLLRQDLHHEVDELNAHVWILYFPIQNDCHVTCKLHMYVHISTKIYLRVNHLPEFGETI